MGNAFLWAVRGDLKPFHDLAALVHRWGALLECLEVEAMAGRLTSPAWVVAEAWRAVGGRALGGDAQILLPADHPAAELVVDLPGEGDDCEAPDIIQAIRRCPASAAWIASVCADDAIAGAGFASAARLAAFDRIRVLNRSRSIPVRYAVGELFRLRGIRLPDGRSSCWTSWDWTRWTTTRPCASNGRDSQPGGLLRDRAVVVPGKGELLVDWQVRIHPLGLAAVEGGTGRCERLVPAHQGPRLSHTS